MKSIKIIIALVGMIVAVLLNNVCFGETIYNNEDEIQYHFGSSVKNLLQIYLGGDENSTPQITDDGKGHIIIKNAGINDEYDAKLYIEDNYGCDEEHYSMVKRGSIIGVQCTGHGPQFGIVKKGGKKYHFNKKVVVLENSVAGSIAAAETWARSHGCTNPRGYQESKNDHTGDSIYTVECLGEDSTGYSTEIGKGFNSSLIPSGNLVKPVKITIDKLAGTIILILQILTVGGIIATGIRYMFATGDVKSEIKKTLPFLITGIVIVFAGPTVINFIVEAIKELI